MLSSGRLLRRGFASSSQSKYYDLLKVSQTASDDEIKKAYKKAALEHHPDRGGNVDAFKEISNAYSVLSDPAKRQIYDQYGERGLDGAAGGSSGGPAGFGDPMDIFSQVFGGAARRGPGGLVRGRDAVYKLEVTLEEVAAGTSRTIAYNRDVACAPCGGRGATKIDTCKKCGGSGVVMTRQNIGFLVHMQTACPECNGEGYKVPRDGYCKPCKGGGIVSQKETFQVAVPAGCPEGHQFKFAGKADQLPGHSAGDVIVTVSVKPHSTFFRMGNADLCIRREIPLVDALAGVHFDVTSIGGKDVHSLTSGAHVVAPKDVWVARGLGLPRFQRTTRGDLYVEFTVKFPKSISGMSASDRTKLASLLAGTATPVPEKGCLSSLLDTITGDSTSSPSSPEKSDKPQISMEKIDAADVKKRVAQAFEPQPQRSQQRTQQGGGPHPGGVDPQQCQQQ